MFPDEFEQFDLIHEDELVPVGEDMQEIIDAINALPGQMETVITKQMLGKMEIHDNMMDVYDTDGNIIRTFDLFDVAGLPTTTSGVFKREIHVSEVPAP